EDPFAEIDARQELGVVRNLVRHTGGAPGLGLEAGSRYHLTTYGIWGYAVLASPTLRSASQVGLRYLDLTFAFVRFEAEEAAGAMHLRLRDREIPEDCRRFLVERDAAAVVQMHRDLFREPIPLRHVDFALPAPPDPTVRRRFDAFFPGPVAWSRPAHRLAVDAAWLDRPLPQANETTARLCEAQCRELLARRHVRSGVSEHVRRQLLRPGGAGAGMVAVAAALGMAPRTLRRRLAEEDTTFRRLADEVREALAEEMLAGRMRVEEVAERLGYAEPASFIHAFRRWKGVSPGAWRAGSS
ncbi:MAG: AraC family transcriptional regulator, partial [Myxococcota bacterium]|nr:AraC family transcriptional regulator [Myxococcota bacterium]